MSVKSALLEIASRRELDLRTPEPNNPAGSAASGAIRHSAVALILRFKPGKEGSHLSSEMKVTSLEEFFAQDWVCDHNAEILFIKRSTRETDRWSGHVALPGGRRDIEDESDLVTAKRETLEEVGLDLDKYALYVGPLNQRYVTVHWGGRIIMILCTYVFVLTTPAPVPLTLQTSEVALAFWCPIAAIANPEAQCRFVRSIDGVANEVLIRPLRELLKWCVGSLLFPGIKMPENIAYGEEVTTYPSMIMWGLTHSIVTDLLDIITPDTKDQRPRLPIASQWDTRLVSELLGKSYFEKTVGHMQQSIWKPRSDGKLVGYIIDRYYSSFKITVTTVAILRCSIGSAIAINIMIKVIAKLRK
ncbi:NUDIX hydrolase domain-like protein [Lipomyces doorenjongii]|uniref:NUDIX hydrolase domain-like protein n=1 Tax=Lipomyces doorenjongii TaxID=383834 RepID=UPI0034CD6AF5